MKIVLTGVLACCNNRNEVGKKLEKLGAVIVGSVSGKTDLLITGEKLEDGRDFSEGTKYKTAVQKGIKVMSEQEFLNELKQKWGIELFEMPKIFKENISKKSDEQ